MNSVFQSQVNCMVNRQCLVGTEQGIRWERSSLGNHPYIGVFLGGGEPYVNVLENLREGAKGLAKLSNIIYFSNIIVNKYLTNRSLQELHLQKRTRDQLYDA